MKYTVVNKNLLIPSFNETDNLHVAIDQLIQMTMDKNNNYASNVYIICSTSKGTNSTPEKEFYYQRIIICKNNK